MTLHKLPRSYFKIEDRPKLRIHACAVSAVPLSQLRRSNNSTALRQLLDSSPTALAAQTHKREMAGKLALALLCGTATAFGGRARSGSPTHALNGETVRVKFRIYPDGRVERPRAASGARLHKGCGGAQREAREGDAGKPTEGPGEVGVRWVRPGRRAGRRAPWPAKSPSPSAGRSSRPPRPAPWGDLDQPQERSPAAAAALERDVA